MSTGINWIDAEQTILDVNLGDKWSWSDFNQITQNAYTLVREVPHRVDIIIHDNAPNEPLPKGNSMQHMQYALKTLPDNVGVIAVQANDMITKTFVSVITRLVQKIHDRLLVVPSVSEGVEILRKRNRAEHK